MAYREAIRLLKRRAAVTIAPKGTREAGGLYQGAAWLSYTRRAPLIPVTVASYQQLKGNAPVGKEIVRIIVSKQLPVDYDLPREEAVTDATDRLGETFERDYARALGWAAFDAAKKLENANAQS